MAQLELTSHKYKQHLANPLVEIKYFFESYNELSAEPLATNPINGKKINFLKLFEPMRKKRFVLIGALLLAISLFTSFHILKTDGNSVLISVLIWLTAFAGAAMMLPSLLLNFIHKIKHDHARDQARFVAQGVKKTYRPDLTKVTDEILMALFAEDSILTVEVFMLLQNLQKDVTNDDVMMVLNYITGTGDGKAELLHLVIDENAFAQSKVNFEKILDEGLAMSNDDAFIEDPKIIQLIIYSLATRLLTNPYASGNLVSNFTKLEGENLHYAYETYCEKFLNYCKDEYDFEIYVDEVEGRIMSAVVDLI